MKNNMNPKTITSNIVVPAYYVSLSLVVCTAENGRDNAPLGGIRETPSEVVVHRRRVFNFVRIVRAISNVSDIIVPWCYLRVQ